MIKDIYDKRPVFCGIVLGQGLLIVFVLLEYFLVATGISDCGVIVDACLRIVFGLIALLLMRTICREEFSRRFTAAIPKDAWLFCIPFFLYLGVQFLYLPNSEGLTAAYLCTFLLTCLRELATGFWEEAASKGLVMSGMLAKWKNTLRGRLGIVFLSGVLFGTLHMLNVLFTGDVIACLWQSLYASAFGVFMAAIYLHTENILLCMAFHALWDIIIRIPGHFCTTFTQGPLLDFIYIAQDVLQLGLLPIMAVIMCLAHKPVCGENQ